MQLSSTVADLHFVRCATTLAYWHSSHYNKFTMPIPANNKGGNRPHARSPTMDTPKKLRKHQIPPATVHNVTIAMLPTPILCPIIALPVNTVH